MIDRNAVGQDLGSVRFPIERGKLAELARAFHEPDGLWHDPDAATQAGLGDVPVPPTVTVLADHWREHGALEHAIALAADLDRLLHGEASWEYLAPVRLGDELTARSHVTDLTTREGRRGGAMTLVSIETTFHNQRDELVVRRQDTLIETGEAT
ncbi:MAG TPA: MaoC family dehydratase N-terminal domain-containing protein [Baekduia sp.]|uniref:FAS1-like dehydratase domain-containing protein n=1 Tax=Baekduia sp. TaxID=2600305 RepID=UPI002C1917E5|nr:MaoC family dehydratase N-terminal domain-containing protein [Baekduia sp.]HMJ36697.1 MaoC family dehydratase N-terminal domain-containing protein [Baekduia sp.]